MTKGLRGKIKTLTAALAASLIFCSCNLAPKEETVHTYSAKSGMYCVSLPGEWTYEDTMELGDVMTLSRKDGIDATFIRIAKEDFLRQSQVDVKSLEDFFTYSESLFLGGSFSSAKLKEAEAIELTGLNSTIAKEGTVTQQFGGKGKAFVQCGETDSAYYYIMFAASKSYGKKMDSIKKNMTFEELKT